MLVSDKYSLLKSVHHSLNINIDELNLFNKSMAANIYRARDLKTLARALIPEPRL